MTDISNNISPSKKPFLDNIQVDDQSINEGTSSPFKAMSDDDGGVGIGIELSPSKMNLQVHKGYADFDEETASTIGQ